MAYSNVAQLRMLAGDSAAAVDWRGRALAIAGRIGDREVEMHALNNIGAARVRAGDVDEGEQLMTRGPALAHAEDAPEHVARAYTNLGSGAVGQRRHAVGERALRTGMAYCLDRDLESWRLYMSARLAASLLEQAVLQRARPWPGRCWPPLTCHRSRG